MNKGSKVAVLDCGGQYSHLIANRVRRLSTYSEIRDAGTKAPELKNYRGIIISGGPQSVYEKTSPKVDPEIFELKIPVLGICYGHQLIAHTLNGKVVPGAVKEYGKAELKIKKAKGIFKGLKGKIRVWMSHGDEVRKLPRGFEIFGYTKDAKHAAIGDFKRKIYGTQFHVEVTHTPLGMKILSNFLDICGCKREWNMKQFLEKELLDAKKKVGDKKVFMLVSGGVDSTVAFTLLNRALSDRRVYGLFVNTGFLRKNEVYTVKKSLESLGFRNFHVYDARKDFFKALKGVSEPEKKREIIGSMFLKIQKKAVKKLKLNSFEWLLGQGTIYPDTIETAGTAYAAKIKTHHNRVKEIQEMIKKGQVIEPLKELYKDEVREAGTRLGLPEKLVERHPFPGPGLAVRIVCLKKPMPLANHKDAENSINKFLLKEAPGLTSTILPLQSVGVQGDTRTYRHPAILLGKINNWKKLEDISTKLTNRFHEINRVCVLLYPEEIKKIDIKKSCLTQNRVSLLQKADEIVRLFVEKQGIQQEIWQFPVVLLPVSFNKKRGEAIVLRPVMSQEAMTANFYPMPWKLLRKLTKKLAKIRKVSGILYDITNKPPGTIEWE